MRGDLAFAASLQHALFLVFAVCLADLLADFKLQHFLFAQADAKNIARLLENAEQKFDFFINRFRSGFLRKPLVLILDYDCFAEIHQNLRAEQPGLDDQRCIRRKWLNPAAGFYSRRRSLRPFPGTCELSRGVDRECC
jgi:hypothetical protein